jgi:hypothetical protein
LRRRAPALYVKKATFAFAKRDIMRSLPMALAAALILAATPASAAIRITSSYYENGMTVVTGEAGPNQTVTIDGEYKTKASASGNFKFRKRYKPATCMTFITAGDSSYSALVNGCLLYDAWGVPGFGEYSSK